MARAETTIIYGNSGTGKTSQLVYLAKRMYKKTGKRSRLISFDDGGWKPVADEGLIDMGIVEPYLVVGKENIMAHVRKLAKGYWPQVVSGERVLVETSASEMSRIGLYFIEGLTSLAQAHMAHIGNQELKVGEENANVRYEEEGEIFGGNSRTHYRLVQNEVHNIVSRFGALPINQAVWTARVAKGVDLQKDALYGPDVIGKAVTGEVPSWFGECIHFYEYFSTVDVEGKSYEKKDVLAYYENHKDESTGVPYLAKPRLTPSQMGAMRDFFPGGYVPLTLEKGIEPYFDAVALLSKKAKTALQIWKDEVDKARAERLANKEKVA